MIWSLTAHATAFAEIAALVNVDWVQRAIAYGGPVTIFVLLFLCGMGLPLPEDIPLIIGGFFAAKGQMHLVGVAVCSWLGILAGDSMLYYLGWRYGREISRLPLIGRHLTEKRLEKTEKLFERYGIWVIAVGRLIAGIRGAMVAAAGATRYNFTKFIIVDGLAALVSGGAFVSIGYYLGRKIDSVQEIRQTIGPYENMIIAGLVAVSAAFGAYFWLRAKRHRGITDVALDKVVARTEAHPLEPRRPRPSAGESVAGPVEPV